MLNVLVIAILLGPLLLLLNMGFNRSSFVIRCKLIVAVVVPHCISRKSNKKKRIAV